MFDAEQMAKIVESCGVHVYDTELAKEFDRRIFRLYITSKDGITLEKCAEVSRILSPLFDVEPPVEGEYLFEVSSPGIERPLTKPSHFAASLGERVKLRCKDKTKCIGTLEAFDGVSLHVKSDEGVVSIPLELIDRARTYFEW